ncbi:DUF397 domain-containing protein [Amycolatopsis sp. DG1A-15b]|uniref:DUF397 domain-containing protein n=1 Tax=Amycolatopsis sp. DG1A-15b TaxID=3052846 RepID=UPI00255B7138|nr:DUF397 domain-containing protein [Amycolatopsis sp. DG1A-15b]WIX88167.1 DUF397 domain-containing protein [Amycolatopsis sp. DG1A-15b]
MTTEITSTADHDRSEWFKSSYSNAGGSCVETRFVSGAAFVRDSKDRRADSPVIALSSTAWTCFLDTVTPTDA